MTSLQSKYQVVKQPALPGMCIGCGAFADGQREFIDFNFSLDYYGSVNFCGNCGREIGATMGMVPADTIPEMQRTIDELRAEASEYKIRVRALLDVVAAFGIEHNSSGDERSSDNAVDAEPAKRNPLFAATEH